MNANNLGCSLKLLVTVLNEFGIERRLVLDVGWLVNTTLNSLTCRLVTDLSISLSVNVFTLHSGKVTSIAYYNQLKTTLILRNSKKFDTYLGCAFWALY
jgi:hypothetical protein